MGNKVEAKYTVTLRADITQENLDVTRQMPSATSAQYSTLSYSCLGPLSYSP